MLRPIVVHCDGCGDEYKGMTNGHTREEVEATLRTEGWDVVEPSSERNARPSHVGVHVCPSCVRLRGTPARVVQALGPAERDAEWRDARGDCIAWIHDSWYLDCGVVSGGQHDWAYIGPEDEPLAKHPPYTEILPKTGRP